MMRGLFVPGDSPVHRVRAGWKLLALPLAGTVLFLLSGPLPMALALAAILALFTAARLRPRLVAEQMRPVLPVLVVLFLAQLWLFGIDVALTVALRLCALILLAALVTLTTSVSAMVSVLERVLTPLRPLGVDPEKVGLAISLVLRFIPAVAAVFEEVREAQKARGQERNLVALAVPLIVRTLKMADEIAEAIDARS